MEARIIVALDYSCEEKACLLADELSGLVDFYKVGLSLFMSGGPQVISRLKERNLRVFLDLKFHDIPNTVAEAVESAILAGVDMLNIHISGGREMMEASVARVSGKRRSDQNIIGVTALTSLDQNALTAEIGVARSLYEHVVSMALLAKESGLDGVVASPQEASTLRHYCGPRFLLVTPGIRPAGTSVNEHKRFLTPGEAVAAGADYIVVGRPVTRSPSPRRVVENMAAELSELDA